MRARISVERLRASLWFWPMVSELGALALTLSLLPVRLPVGQPSWGWPGDADGDRTTSV